MSEDEWYADTWAGRRDALAHESEQTALSLLESRNPIAWLLARRYARLARIQREATMYADPDAALEQIREAAGNIG